MEKHLHNDPWLSNVLQRKVYKLDVSDELIAYRGSGLEKYLSALNLENVFVYAKVKVHDADMTKFLEKSGFHLVDTNITFESVIDAWSQGMGLSEVRFAFPEDRQSVRDLAANSFSYSRFHLDPLISNVQANQIKASWAENFFFGGRGDSMVVASLDGKIAGFLQLLHSGKDLVIDLIGVDGNHRRKGIATDMIGFAQRSLKGFKKMRVGTQLANMPSIRMYESLNFLLIDASYVFHYHNS